MENPIKMGDLGRKTHHFRKPLYWQIKQKTPPRPTSRPPPNTKELVFFNTFGRLKIDSTKKFQQLWEIWTEKKLQKIAKTTK